jgi:hypothetical protein
VISVEVELKWVRVKDPRRVEYWNTRWDLAGDIDLDVTSTMEREAVIDGQPMGSRWTAEAAKHAHECGCGECAECLVAIELMAARLMPVAIAA